MQLPKAPNIFLIVVLPALFLIALTSLVNIVMFYNDVDNIRKEQESIVNDIHRSIETEIHDAILATNSLKALFLSIDKVNETEFILFAKSRIEDFNAFGRNVTLQWIDQDSIVRYIYPLTTVNKAAINLDNKQFPNRMQPILKAIETRNVVVTEPLELVQGYPGIIIYAPIFKDEQYLGCAVSVVKLDDFTRKISDEIKVRYKQQLQTETRIFSLFGQSIYDKEGNKIPSPLDPEARGYLQPLTDNGNTISKEISFADKTWTLLFETDYKTEAGRKMSIYGALFLTFLIISIALIYLNYKGRLRNIRVLEQEIDLRKSLEFEVIKRKEYEKKVEEQYSQLKRAQNEVLNSNEELKKLNDLMLGRELKMIEMKKQLSEENQKTNLI